MKTMPNSNGGPPYPGNEILSAMAGAGSVDGDTIMRAQGKLGPVDEANFANWDGNGGSSYPMNTDIGTQVPNCSTNAGGTATASGHSPATASGGKL